MRFFVSLALPAALLAACAPAHAVVPGLNDKLAWSRETGTGQSHIVRCSTSAGCVGTPITSGDVRDNEPAWNPVRDQIVFQRLPDCEAFCPEIWVMNSDGTNGQRVTDNDGGTTASGTPSWAPDGDRIAFWTDRAGGDEIWVMNADGSNQHPLTSSGCDAKPDWSPGGDKIAFHSCRDGNNEIYVMNADGSGQTRVTDNPAADDSPAWSPDGQRIAFVSSRTGSRDIWVMNPDGSAETRLAGLGEAPAWSPDNTRIAFASARAGTGSDSEIYFMRPDGTEQVNFNENNTVGDSAPDWGPRLPRGYARPKSASPLYASLVPAYAQCTAPDRTHGPPLAFPSCGSPGQTSAYLTVGTPDANGAPPKSVSYVKFRVAPGVPGPPHDTQVLMYIDVTDVRCAPGAQPCGPANDQAGADYTGELEGRVTLRVTDTDNATAPGGGVDHATMTDYVLRLPLSCAATADTTVGATCVRTTSLTNFGVPGIVPEGDRAIWELGTVRFDDGGPDGVVSTADNAPFLTQGVFVP